MELKFDKDYFAILMVFITLLVNMSQILTYHFLWLIILAITVLVFWAKSPIKGWFIDYAILFGIYLCLSYLWAVKNELTIIGARSIIVEYMTTLFCLLIINFRSNNEEITQRLISIFVLSTIIYCVYVFFGTPLSDWGTVYIGDTIGLGKNSVGMRCAWGMLFAFYLAKTSRYKILYVMSMVLFAVFVAFAGSRKAILIAIAGISFFQLFCGGKKNIVRNFLIFIIIISVSLYMLLNNEFLYIMIGERLEETINAILGSGSGDGSMQERFFYKQQAIKMFIARPILGYGIDGFRNYMSFIGYSHIAYSHCNYTELLANYGLIGLALFYVPRFFLVFKVLQTKVYRNNQLILLLLIATIVELVMDYEMVSYYDLSSQLIFGLASPIMIEYILRTGLSVGGDLRSVIQSPDEEKNEGYLGWNQEDWS